MVSECSAGKAAHRQAWCLTVALLAVGRDSAAAPAFQFGWDVPAGCPSVDVIQEEFTHVVGRPWQDLAGRWRETRATVVGDAGRFRLRVRMVSRRGAVSERELVASSCTEAAEAAVAILATGMAPEADDSGGSAAPPAMTSAIPPATATATATAAARSSGDLSPDDAAADATATTPLTGRAGLRVTPLLGARVGVDLGTLAVAAPFGQIVGGIEIGRFAALGFVGTTGKVLGDAAGSSSGAEMSLLFGGLSGCYRFNEHNPIVSGCVGAEVGSLEARGVGTGVLRDGAGAWFASLAQGALDWDLGAASSVSLGVTAVVPLRQLRIVLVPEEVHHTPTVAARPWLGFGIRFR